MERKLGLNHFGLVSARSLMDFVELSADVARIPDTLHESTAPRRGRTGPVHSLRGLQNGMKLDIMKRSIPSATRSSPLENASMQILEDGDVA
jgi:hypothetical protein